MVSSIRYSCRKILFVLFLTTVILWSVSAKRFHSIAGPFKTVVRRVEHCPSQSRENVIDWSFKDVTTRKTYKLGPSYNLNITVRSVLEKKYSFHMKMSSWSNMGGWIENAHILKFKNACEAVPRFIPKLWKDVFIATAGEDVHCPIMPGFYRLQNLTMEVGDLQVKDFFYGRWRVNFHCVRPNEDIVACARVYGDTVPR